MRTDTCQLEDLWGSESHTRSRVRAMIKHIHRSSNRHYHQGLTLVEVLVVLSIISILIMMLLPMNHRHQQLASTQACLNNLRQIGVAFRIYAGDNSDRYPMNNYTKHHLTNSSESGDLPALYRSLDINLSPQLLICPSDLRRSADSFLSLNNSNISYFVGTGASPGASTCILAGDRNIVISEVPVTPGINHLLANDTLTWIKSMHFKDLGKLCGNVLFANGAAFMYKTNADATVQSQKVLTNDLIVP